MNFTILVTFISFIAHVFKEIGLDQLPTFKTKMLSGLLNGLLGVVLMLFTVHITATIIIDFRNIPIIITTIYGGLPSAIITTLMICFFRIAYFGLTESSIVSFITISIQAIGFVLISRTNQDIYKKWIASAIYSMFIGSFGFTYLIHDKLLLKQSIVSFLLGTSIVTYLVYHLVEYYRNSNIIYRRLKEESTKDFLTGLSNVRQFDSLFNNLGSMAKENNEPFSLLILDIDHFKKVNDTYGHANGDLVLKELSNILTVICRNFDVISRIGGEEFSAMLNNCNSIRAIEVAERIRNAVQSHRFKLSNNKKITITISIGISTYPETTTNIELMKEQADKALYQAKRDGRNKTVLSVH